MLKLFHLDQLDLASILKFFTSTTGILVILVLIALGFSFFSIILYIHSRKTLSQLKIKLMKDERELLFNNFSNYFGEELDTKKLVKLAKIIRKKTVEKYGLKWVTTYKDLIYKIKKSAIPIDLQSRMVDFFTKISELEYSYNPDASIANEIKDDAIFLLKEMLPSPGEIQTEEKKIDEKEKTGYLQNPQQQDTQKQNE